MFGYLKHHLQDKILFYQQKINTEVIDFIYDNEWQKYLPWCQRIDRRKSPGSKDSGSRKWIVQECKSCPKLGDYKKHCSGYDIFEIRSC